MGKKLNSALIISVNIKRPYSKSRNSYYDNIYGTFTACGEDILLLKQKKVCYFTDIYKRNVIIT